jgi:hypothetical protein
MIISVLARPRQDQPIFIVVDRGTSSTSVSFAKEDWHHDGLCLAAH